MGGYGAYKGAKASKSLAGGLLGFAGGFVGGALGASAGYNAYNGLTAASTAELFQMKQLYKQLRANFETALEGPTLDPTYVPNIDDFDMPELGSSTIP